MSSSVAAVIPAAGSGTRLGAGTPKAFVELGGRTILERCVEGVGAAGLVDVVVVAVPEELVDHTAALLPDVRVVVGGAERSHSVRAALTEIGDADVVLVHDAARTLTPPAVFGRVVDAVRAGAPAVVPALPVADTLKRVDDGGRVISTVDRGPLRAVQTPQGFAVEALRAAYRGSTVATDDAGLAELAGYPVQVVAGDALAFKITTAFDLRLAELLLGAMTGTLPTNGG
nr:2-C-methyl-D-erythritol 4-phosphate cytidylyltransferase [Williamsia sterculiae]